MARREFKSVCLLKGHFSMHVFFYCLCFYSDACAGQNRNKYIASSLLHRVKTQPKHDVIEHQVLETGHTQMECDSMHSTTQQTKLKLVKKKLECTTNERLLYKLLHKVVDN